MAIGTFAAPSPVNEPVKSYAPGSPERASLKAELERQAGTTVEVPLRIGGESITTGDTAPMVMPHDHGHQLGTFHKAGGDQVAAAIEAAETARPAWAALPGKSVPGSFCVRPSCSPGAGATASTPRRCWASPRPPTRPRSTPRAS